VELWVTVGIAALAVVVGGAALAYRSPFWALSVWMALLPVQLDTVDSMGFRFAPADLMLCSFTLAALLSAIRDRRGRGCPDAFVAAGGILLLWLVVASVRTTLQVGTLPSYVLYNKLLGFVSLIVTYEVIARSLQAETVESALRRYVAIGSAWNLVGLGALALWRGGAVLTPMIYNPGREDRIMGLLMDPNAYGGFVASVFIVQLGLLVFGSDRSRVDWLNTLLLVAGLSMADSRSAWLAVILAVVCMLVYRESRSGRAAVAALSVVVVLGIALIVLSSQQPVRIHALQERLELVRESLRLTASAPFLGVGLGSRPYVIHSSYLWLLAESGIPGVLLLCAMLFCFRRVALRARQQPHPAARVVGTIGISILVLWAGMMLGLEAMYQRYYWVLAGVVGAMDRLAVDRTEGHVSTENQ
jgi:putative inorganic carbon (hco3(-)) transporter